jgi:hypothetical protein
MPIKLVCFTLFDITQTNVPNRGKPTEHDNIQNWTYKRNTQCNFDTLLQAISLRSQPEEISEPIKLQIKLDGSNNFGFVYQGIDSYANCWTFNFTVQHTSVFENGVTELGALYNDCDKIPMVICGTEIPHLPNFLDISPELKNVYFVKYESEY